MNNLRKFVINAMVNIYNNHHALGEEGFKRIVESDFPLLLNYFK